MLARADADVILMAAAVSDYRPSNPETGKRPKSQEQWTIALEPTDDVFPELARRRRDGQVLVGFAADSGEGGLARAREKLANKGGNLFVFNDVSRSDIGFEAEDNEIVLISPRGERRIGRRSKEDCAVVILDEVEALLEGA
jgi:phosphopantothenoylcysteine decarboxylase/phosphopantothenate--cysteine ligase